MQWKKELVVVVVGMHCGLQSKLRGFKKTKQEMCASQNTSVYINYQTVKNYIYSNSDLDLWPQGQIKAF